MKYVTGALAVLAIALCLALAVRVDRLQRRLDAYPVLYIAPSYTLVNQLQADHDSLRRAFVGYQKTISPWLDRLEGQVSDLRPATQRGSR